MRGVLRNNTNWFWGPQTSGCSDFCMFLYSLKNLHKKSAETTCKKKLFDEQRSPTWSAWKKFSNHFRIQNLLWKTSLGPWVSAEINGVVVRCVDRFLLRQTWAAAHFQNLVLFKSTILKLKNDDKWWLSKNMKTFFLGRSPAGANKFQTKSFEIWGSLE